jgi:hypothetical protein
MINKGELQSTISKYNLGGMIDAVKWTVQNKHLTIKFNAPTKDMIGEITHTSFDIEDCEIAIYNTSQLDKLLAITSGDVNLQLERIGKIFGRLVIEDTNYKLNYSLSDLMLIPKPGTPMDPDSYVVESILESDVISAVIRAKNALQSDNVNFTITTNFDGEQVLTLIFGDNSTHTHKVEYIVPNTVITGNQYNFNIPFNSEMIRVIFANNKDANKAYMSLNIDGLLRLVFEGDKWKSTYYIIGTTN